MRNLWLLCDFLLLFAVSLAHATGLEDQVAKNPSEHGEFVYSLVEGNCAIRWILSRDGINSGVISQRSDCARPLKDQLNFHRAVFQRIQRDQKIGAIFWGGLATVPEWSKQLVVAAARSKDWDQKRGGPKNGSSANQYVTKVIQGQHAAFFSGLEQVFADLGLKLKASSVEKVIVARADHLVSWNELRDQNRISASSRLPYDCLIWFSDTQ